ncbi:MAG: zf-HC2 domain-containing protein [Candidatus Zixiibacteriota bacterium]
MENGKSKYEEKLSAYLDGELSPEEMAEIAAELESNSALADKLEQLRRMDDLAGAALQDFDEALLAKLEHNIMDNLDAKVVKLPEFDDIAHEEPQKKIIPVWQRYVTIAASIAVFFLVGKMAFDETKNKSLLAPERHTDQMMVKPRMQLEEVKKIESDEAVEDEDGYIDADQPQVEEEPLTGRSEHLNMDDINEYEADKAVISPEEMRETSYDATPVQSPIPPPVMSNDVSKKAKEVPKPRAAQEVQKEGTIEPATETTAAFKEITAIADQDAGKGVVGVVDTEEFTLDEYDDVLHTNVVGDFEPSAIQKSNESARQKSLYKSEASASILDSLQIALMPLDSLKHIFALYVPEVVQKDKEYLKRDVALMGSTIGGSESKMQVLIDSLAQLPGIDNDVEEIENLYLKARIYYELYLATDNIQHYREALTARDELNTLLDSQLAQHPGDMRLTEYANDIKSWRFSR